MSNDSSQEDPPVSTEKGQGRPGQEMLQGRVARVIYRNAENGYTVIALEGLLPGEEIIATGPLGLIQPQEELEARGKWRQDRRYGRQFVIEEYRTTLPTESDALLKYLSSGLIPGIGEGYARKLVEHFGESLFSVLESEPHRLKEVKGLGKSRREKILDGWEAHRSQRGLVLFLQRFGLSPSLAPKLITRYGVEAEETLRTNPYALVSEVRGIGFQTADKIARSIGIPHESPERIQAGVLCLLQETSGDGHCYYPVEPLLEAATKNLAVDEELIVAAIAVLTEQGHLVLEGLPDGTRAVYLARFRQLERECASMILRLVDTGKMLPSMDLDQEIADFEKESKFELAESQRSAVRLALQGGVLVITGGPGTGKTTIMRAVLRILRKHNVRTTVAAPTGRAAKRLQEVTRHEAGTIHRMLQFDPASGRWTRTTVNPLKTDVVLVDEASMIDLALFHALLQATPASSSLILIGDADQLPSVGPGNVLRDLLGSGVVAVARLDTVFRQARQSLIISNAHRVNHGEMPILATPAEVPGREIHRDFFFVESDDPQQVLSNIRELVTARIKTKYGYDPRDEVQVLSPMRRGPLGTVALNQMLQSAINPQGPGVSRNDQIFRVGDKVIQKSNDYDKDVFNGDVGVISGIDKEEQQVLVRFDGKDIPYPFTDLDDLDLAYAVSIHKSQGSEYRAVVVVLHTAHFVMLQRNLLYTAITRGRSLVVLVGSKNAVRLAVENSQVKPRYSALGERLKILRRKVSSPKAL
jgi:exodeoxyribonuclease V alpha subunit